MHSYSQRFAAKIPGVDLTTNYVNGVSSVDHTHLSEDVYGAHDELIEVSVSQQVLRTHNTILKTGPYSVRTKTITHYYIHMHLEIDKSTIFFHVRSSSCRMLGMQS